MKKIKLTLIAITIVGGMGAAIAANAKEHQAARLDLYFLGGDGVFYPAGVEGVDYTCLTHFEGVCTYTYDPARRRYTPYNFGMYGPISIQQ
ncbi:hypothetical protein LX64_00416 [Chitinophaga skermanii]|uniref:Uncharacterized protein n=1 Tax=Chitinophaga skermanii TaxID=331697 RepID=A0A327R1T7_9BACT|nr:hypothetical protein [Chitinophaga skermanii]RAJ10809.1 hypothetical protein LX64_00416 [Chitinophaga skermanii]